MGGALWLDFLLPKLKLEANRRERQRVETWRREAVRPWAMQGNPDLIF